MCIPCGSFKTGEAGVYTVAVGYKSAISTCIGVDMVEILGVREVSSSSWKPVNRGPVARFKHTFSKLSEKHERYRYIFQIVMYSQGKRSSKYQQL